jgi:23S rRNA U2552 (ribose-2'-O)-methylase RlmE/FtsJ
MLIDPQESEIMPQPVINESLCFYLNDIKHHINTHEYMWETFKRFTNTYEYIHTTIPYKKHCISRYRPISRSFFKMIELIHFFELGTNSENSMKTFHLAEGPGGFIEAMVKYRVRSDDKYIGMTLLDKHNSDYNIPAWKKTQHFLQENKNVHIESGLDKTGNILSIDNFVYIHELYGSSMDLITADGGFDFSVDFDHQEINMTKLLYGQIVYALCMQKQGGHFVLKIFDIFMQHTVDMLVLLSSMYERVYITKPNTSRSANSEKYIVCKGFIHASSYQFFPYLYKSFRKILQTGQTLPVAKLPSELVVKRLEAPCQTLPVAKPIQGNRSDPLPNSSGDLQSPSELVIGRPSALRPKYITRIFCNVPSQHFFMNRLEEYNIIIGQNQIENIYITLSFIVGECMPQSRSLLLPYGMGVRDPLRAPSVLKGGDPQGGSLTQRGSQPLGTEGALRASIPSHNVNLCSTNFVGGRRPPDKFGKGASVPCSLNTTNYVCGIRPPEKFGGSNHISGDFRLLSNNETMLAMKDTFKGIECIEFPESAKGTVADTPNQRNFYRTKIQNLIKTNIQKCVQWCIQHNLAYNY